LGTKGIQASESQLEHPLRLGSLRRQMPHDVLPRAGHRDRSGRPHRHGARGLRGRHRHSRETISFFDSRAASRVCQARLAHFTRTGNSDTPERTASFPSPAVFTGSPGFPVTIRWKSWNSWWAWTRDFPFTASVMRDADAFEIAQPWPTKAISAIVSSRRRTYTVTRSPHRGLCPTADASASAISWKLRGFLL